MKYLFILVVVFSFNVISAPNSIIAVVNNNVITYDSIAKQINKNTTKEEKLTLINQQIDRLLQKEKIQELNIKPNPETVNAVLLNIAKQNNLTLTQLRTNNQFNEVVERVSEELSFRKLQELVLQQTDINITQTEIEQVLADNPPTADSILKQIKIKQIVLNVNHEESTTENYIAEINQQIKNGASLTELAKKYSKDPIMESMWIEKSKLPESLQQQLSSLKRGEILSPFKIKQDWLVIKIDDEREFDTHISNIKTQLLKSKRNAFFQTWVRMLRTKDIYIDIFEHKL